MQQVEMNSYLIEGATLIDGVADAARDGQSILIENGRIAAIGPTEALPVRPDAVRVDASGRYAIPGLLNANVHLLLDIRLEILARYFDAYDDLIFEAAQVTLKNGFTTVFDTWGPRRHLMKARDDIDAGKVAGSRIYCAGNIVGFDGPFSPDFDFLGKGASAATAAFTRRVNAIWVENVGRHLMWLGPRDVAREVRKYLNRGIDFVKYASNDHGAFPGCFLTFSPDVQRAIVAEAHEAGVTAQAHTHTLEGLKIAIEAGCDLIQHADLTGPVPIPQETFELMAKHGTGAVVFGFSDAMLSCVKAMDSDAITNLTLACAVNAENFIKSDVRILYANDGGLYAHDTLAEPLQAKMWAGLPDADRSPDLASGHIAWFRSMRDKGMAAMEMLKAATRNIALAYGKDDEIGSIAVGKRADILILDKNPLDAPENYRSIHKIMKDGAFVDHASLPTSPIMTKAPLPPLEEEAHYIACFATKLKPGCGGH